MTYNQVQLFQINDYENHYVDIEITGYRALYSKSIADRGVAGLISWLGTARPVDCFNKSVSDCYIRVYRSFWQGTANFWLGLLLATTLKRGTQLIFKILEIYLRGHARQLKYLWLRAGKVSRIQSLSRNFSASAYQQCIVGIAKHSHRYAK